MTQMTMMIRTIENHSEKHYRPQRRVENDHQQIGGMTLQKNVLVSRTIWHIHWWLYFSGALFFTTRSKTAKVIQQPSQQKRPSLGAQHLPERAPNPCLTFGIQRAYVPIGLGTQIHVRLDVRVYMYTSIQRWAFMQPPSNHSHDKRHCLTRTQGD